MARHTPRGASASQGREFSPHTQGRTFNAIPLQGNLAWEMGFTPGEGDQELPGWTELKPHVTQARRKACTTPSSCIFGRKRARSGVAKGG